MIQLFWKRKYHFTYLEDETEGSSALYLVCNIILKLLLFFSPEQWVHEGQHILQVIGMFSKNNFAVLMSSQETKEKMGHLILEPTVI